MAVAVEDIITRAQIILQDTTGTRWPTAELLNWLNDSYKEIVQARPDLYPVTTPTFTCVAGTRQVAPTGALRMIDVVRNGGGTKRAVRLIDRRILDDQLPSWHSQSGSTEIQHWMFDPRTPREFLVYPPAASGASLEIVYSAVPAPHDTATGNIAIIDSYGNVMLDYILYRAYTKDAEYTANAARAQAHYGAMQNAISSGAASDAAGRPGAQPGLQPTPGQTTVR
ncbi:MAG: hypothetical protein EOM21_14095 [Gammaproteobacteria bacterium]|nr:hypothetical protein [Gammaproteobacteria bacterium]